MALTGNSMGSSEIWDKYHSCCIGNGKFHSAFIPNFTATHAITSTYQTPPAPLIDIMLPIHK